VDASIRHFDLFTGPDAIVAYARQHGMRSELKAGAQLEDLAHMVDQGVPPIVLIDPDGGSNANLHYVTVTGYQRDASGKISELTIADSAIGKTRTISAQEFSEQWGHLKLGNLDTGLHNVMISVVPADGRSIRGMDGQVRSADRIALPTSDLGNTFQSALARGVAGLVTAVTTAADGVWHGLQAAWHSIFG
jgi:hypothetical protein